MSLSFVNEAASVGVVVYSTESFAGVLYIVPELVFTVYVLPAFRLNDGET